MSRELIPLSGNEEDYDNLLSLVGDCRLVLLGEASHGTHEFYRGESPDHAATDRGEGLHGRCRRGRLAGRLPGQPLRAGRLRRPRCGHGLERLPAVPRWMWRNLDVVNFVDLAPVPQ